jgi:class 3 adenylate cyclase
MGANIAQRKLAAIRFIDTVDYGALEAARCAIEIQGALAKRNADATADRQIDLKIDIHIGDVVHRGGDAYRDGQNIASRIEPLTEPSGICGSLRFRPRGWNGPDSARAQSGPR